MAAGPQRSRAALAFHGASLVSFIVLILAAGAGVARGGPGPEVVVRGQMTDESGQPVSGHAVRLIKARTYVTLANFKFNKQSQDLEEARTTTDRHGFFEFTFPVDPDFRYYYLRFYDPAVFDSVRFRVPADRDVSRRARKGRPVLANVELRANPEWPEVKSLIDRYGPASDLGRILRAVGLPTRRTGEPGGREIWWYDAHDVSYVLQGEKVLKTRRAARGEVPEDAAEEAGLRIERIDEEDLEER